MKRLKVSVDPQLLEAARHVTPERTDEAIVNRGLEELVRVANLKRGIKAMRETDDVFWPNYLEEIRPNSYAAYEKRLALYTGKKPRKVTRGRSTR
jgi:hypothetical protein